MSNPSTKIEEIETLLLSWKNTITSTDIVYAQIKAILIEIMNDHSLEYISDKVIDLNWHINRAYQGEVRHLYIAIDKSKTLKALLLVPV